MLSTLSVQTYSQKDLSHYYIKVDGNKPSNFKVEFGQIEYNDKYFPKRVPKKDIGSMEQLTHQLYSSLSEPNTSEKLNIFIHGIWADSKFAWEEMIKSISKDTYENNDGKQKIMLSIIWDSSIDYKKGVRIARLKGDFLSPFVTSLLTSNTSNYKINFLCHSMGNRVFQHIINESDLIDQNTILIDQFVSIGADIESNTFEKGQPLHGLNQIVKDITIYIHNNDRTLGMSRLLNSSDRLGLNGVPDITALPENYRTIDVSLIKDHDDLSSKIGNHRYFYTSPSVREDLKRVLWSKDFSSFKKEMKHPRRLKLLPSTKSE
ncbi:MAG: alpha/beta hydrolase [Saprospiraceae bacterium]|nr:alpha/beta hydrolase [Saprospiraceae bacterium]